MPTPLKDPTLFVLAVRGTPMAVVAAKTRTEVKTYLEEGNLLEIQRVNPMQAHQLGLSGLAIEFAKPEYDPARDTGEEGEQIVQLPAPVSDRLPLE